MAKSYDVGKGVSMTTSGIAAATGCTQQTIRARIRNGWKGKRLLTPAGEKKYNVGHGEKLTTRQIATIIGGKPQNVRERIALGWKGEALLQPLGDRRNLGVPRVNTQIVAYKLALKFKHRIPTTAEIIAVHPMDESTAAYWRNAITRALTP